MRECQHCKNCFTDEVAACLNDGMPTMHTISGESVPEGKYHLESRVGQNGMDFVYKARHAYLKAKHAIKIILPDPVGNDPELVTRFRQEAFASARQAIAGLEKYEADNLLLPSAEAMKIVAFAADNSGFIRSDVSATQSNQSNVNQTFQQQSFQTANQTGHERVSIGNQPKKTGFTSISLVIIGISDLLLLTVISGVGMYLWSVDGKTAQTFDAEATPSATAEIAEKTPLFKNEMVENASGKSTASPEAVGSKLCGANKSGVVDLIGNVSEWTANLASPYRNAPIAGISNNADKKLCIGRGGSIYRNPGHKENAETSTYRLSVR